MRIMNYSAKKMTKNESSIFIDLYKKFISAVIWVRGERKRSAEKFFVNAQRNKNYNVFIIYHGSKPIGFFCFVLNYRKKGVVFLHGIYLDKEHRGKGLAEKIRKKELALFKKMKMKKVVLRTWSSNEALLALNKKTGFTVYRSKRHARTDGSDTLWFMKKL